MNISKEVLELATIVQKRKQLEKEEEVLKNRLKSYMEQNNINLLLGDDNSTLTLVPSVRSSIDKHKIMDALGVDEDMFKARYIHVISYNKMLARFSK